MGKPFKFLNQQNYKRNQCFTLRTVSLAAHTACLHSRLSNFSSANNCHVPHRNSHAINLLLTVTNPNTFTHEGRYWTSMSHHTFFLAQNSQSSIMLKLMVGLKYNSFWVHVSAKTCVLLPLSYCVCCGNIAFKF